MKLLHVSDLHIGKTVCEFSMIDDQKHILQQIIDMALKHHVDALLVAGDVYDKSSPSAEAVSLVDWFLTQLANNHIKTFICAGNHDSAERIAYANSLLQNNGIYISAVFGPSCEQDGPQTNIAHYTFEDEYGPVTFWLIPFVKPVHVRSLFPDANIESYTDALKAVCDDCHVDTTQRNVALVHQFVTATGTSTERSESELNLGGLDNVDFHTFDVFDYVALGHIHGPQRIGRDTCRYSGTPLKYSASEVRQHKSACLITLGEKDHGQSSIEYELLPYQPLHDMRAIRGTLEELTSSEVLNAANPHDYVHVTLTDESIPVNAMQLLRRHYPNVMSLMVDNQQTHAQGALSQASENLLSERKNPLDYFADFFELQAGKALAGTQLELAQTELEDLLGSELSLTPSNCDNASCND